MDKPTFNIGIIAPMEQELKNFKTALAEVTKNPNIKYYAAQSGVGKVAAANEAYNLILSFDLDLMVVIGYAAGTKDFQLGQLVVPSGAQYADVKVPSELHHLVPHLVKEYELVGDDDVKVLTSDSFITKDLIQGDSTESFLFDMESAAVTQTCEEFGIPVLVTKIISDRPQIDPLDTFAKSCEEFTDFSQMVLMIEAYANN